MRILHVVPTYEPAWKTGGVVRAVSQLSRGLSAIGADVTVFTTNSNGDGYLDVTPNTPINVGGVKVTYFSTPMPKSFRYSGKLSKALRNLATRFDILHISSFWNFPGIQAAMEARRQRIPYVISTHGTLTHRALQTGWIKKQLYLNIFENRNIRHSAAVHFTAPAERTDTILPVKVPSFAIPNGLDLQEFADVPSQSHCRRILDIPQDAKVILFLGRINHIKGLDLLVKSFAAFIQRAPQAALIIAGPDDGYKSNLEQLIENLGINFSFR